MIVTAAGEDVPSPPLEQARARGRRARSGRRAPPAGSDGRRTGPLDSGAHERVLPLLVRVRHRRPSRQAGRPDLRRHPRRDARGRPAVPRGVRDPGDDRARDGLGRDHAADGWVDIPSVVREHDHGRRLHGREVRARRRDVRRDHGDPGAVPGHRARCRGLARASRGALRRRARSPRRRRPGDDVRLRVPRDRGADAAPDRDGAPAVSPARRRPQGGRRSVSAAGRQEPGRRSSTATASPRGSTPS